MALMLGLDTRREAVRGFKALAVVWGLKPQEQAHLAGVAKRTLERWYGGQGLPDVNAVERIGALLRIYDGVAAVFDERHARTWLAKPNPTPLFAGDTPLAYMLDGRSARIFDVLRYIDSLRFA